MALDRRSAKCTHIPFDIRYDTLLILSLEICSKQNLEGNNFLSEFCQKNICILILQSHNRVIVVGTNISSLGKLFT